MLRTTIVLACLLLAPLAMVPTAAAEPCEVPGCNVAGAALCVVSRAGEMVKHGKGVLSDCLTQPT